ncbi:hypothetical protein GS982_12660, partial [Rhodococcus hoagii]|nr:hypothetical protein [Prescottella equi]
MSWTAAPMAAFDLETTGPIPTNARIVTAHLALIDGKVTSGRNWLLNPQQGIPEGATAVHGITTEHAVSTDRTTPPATTRSARHSRGLDSGHAVVAFNAAYDLTIIDREGVRLGYAPLSWARNRPVRDRPGSGPVPQGQSAHSRRPARCTASASTTP